MGLWSWMDKKPQKTSGKAKRAKAQSGGNSKQRGASNSPSEWIVTVKEQFGGVIFPSKKEHFYSKSEAEGFYRKSIEWKPNGRTDYVIRLYEARGGKRSLVKEAKPFKLVRDGLMY